MTSAPMCEHQVPIPKCPLCFPPGTMTKMATLPRDETPWTAPGTGVHDIPPTLTVDEQIRAVALAAAAQVWQGKPPSDPDYVIRHAASYAAWIRTGIENPGYRVAR